ncbi:MAG: Flp pilus assembly complex ATPase component TadA [Ectothiorhodospiraceae bacterium]|nr:Flp pilus assembly complex ATPase component TadA [Ectothiorhodospiraceae bacterium]
MTLTAHDAVRNEIITSPAQLRSHRQGDYRLNSKRLGGVLVEMGALTAELADTDLQIGRRPGERIGEYLSRKGWVTSDQVYLALAQRFGVPYVRLRDFTVEPQALRFVPGKFARQHMVMPLVLDKQRLIIAMTNPADTDLLAMLHFMTGRAVEVALASQDDISFSISVHYGDEEVKTALEMLEVESASMEAGTPSARDTEASANEKPVVRLVHNLITDAVIRRASDIHIRPREHGVDVHFRVDGMLRKEREFSKSLLPAVVGRIKILGRMDIAERRLPQDGRSRIRYQDKEVDLRLSVIPGLYGESVVIRLLDIQFAMGKLEDLGFQGEDARRIQHLLTRNNGIFLVTGPTGSGKSTTLYTALGEVQRQNVNIITVEDPVEYHVDGITQIQVNHVPGYTFARALRHILRHDPDVIMVGEIRDPETAKMAVESALTGHLVLSTLHTNNAATTVTRLLEIGIEPYLLNSSLLGVLAQRLVRCNCQQCLVEEEVDPDVRKLVGAGPDTRFFRGAGCDACHQTGIRGRRAAYELLEVSVALRELVVAEASAADIQIQAVRDGMTPLTRHALHLAEQRIIPLSEVYRVRLE